MPVSVPIPAYNASATLARALDSVAAQRIEGLDVVVVDDGSTDATAAIAAAHPLAPGVIRHEANRGSSAALATALAAARFDRVAFLDADDEWLPGKLAAQLPALGDGIALVATGFRAYRRAGPPALDLGRRTRRARRRVRRGGLLEGPSSNIR